MEILYRLGQATAVEVHAEMPDAPSYSSVRSLLSILVGKELVKYTQDGKRYLYQPAKPAQRVRKQAISQLLRTFFEGSPRALVAAILDPKDSKLSANDVAELRRLLDQHKPK
jgi:BlaI family transcriptional regulator, penicillinase repressor